MDRDFQELLPGKFIFPTKLPSVGVWKWRVVRFWEDLIGRSQALTVDLG
jgi:hypothetical protein